MCTGVWGSCRHHTCVLLLIPDRAPLVPFPLCLFVPLVITGLSLQCSNWCDWNEANRILHLFITCWSSFSKLLISLRALWSSLDTFSLFIITHYTPSTFLLWSMSRSIIYLKWSKIKFSLLFHVVHTYTITSIGENSNQFKEKLVYVMLLSARNR